MDCFAPLDLFLAFSGCKVFIDTACSKVMSQVLNVVVILTTLVNMIMLVTYYRSGYLLKLMGFELAYIGNIAFLLIINRNRKNLRDIITRIIKDLPEKSRKRIKKWSTLFAFFGLIQLIRSCIGLVFVQWMWNNSLIIIFLKSFLRCVSALGSFFTSGLIYLFIVKLMYYWEYHYFDRLFYRLSHKDSEKNTKFLLLSMIKDREIMHNFKKRLVKCLSFLPILWFCHLFIFIAGVVLFSQRPVKKHVLLDCLTDGLDIAYEMLVIISVMVSVDQVNLFVKSRCKKVCTILSEDSSYFIIEGGLRDFKERCTEFEFSVYNLFTLNKKLLLGFLSSLLTFTTLFIQIENSIYSTTSTNKTFNNSDRN